MHTLARRSRDNRAEHTEEIKIYLPLIKHQISSEEASRKLSGTSGMWQSSVSVWMNRFFLLSEEFQKRAKCWISTLIKLRLWYRNDSTKTLAFCSICVWRYSYVQERFLLQQIKHLKFTTRPLKWTAGLRQEVNSDLPHQSPAYTSSARALPSKLLPVSTLNVCIGRQLQVYSELGKCAFSFCASNTKLSTKPSQDDELWTLHPSVQMFPLSVLQDVIFSVSWHRCKAVKPHWFNRLKTKVWIKSWAAESSDIVSYWAETVWPNVFGGNRVQLGLWPMVCSTSCCFQSKMTAYTFRRSSLELSCLCDESKETRWRTSDPLKHFILATTLTVFQVDCQRSRRDRMMAENVSADQQYVSQATRQHLKTWSRRTFWRRPWDVIQPSSMQTKPDRVHFPVVCLEYISCFNQARS